MVYTKMFDKKCPRQISGAKSGEYLEICVAAHAEVNCIANAARHGISTKGCTMYMTCEIPCKNCLAVIINAGIENLVVTKIKFYDEQSRYLVDKSHICVRDYEGNFYELNG